MESNQLNYKNIIYCKEFVIECLVRQILVYVYRIHILVVKRATIGPAVWYAAEMIQYHSQS